MDSMIQDVLRPVGFDSNPSPEALQEKTGRHGHETVCAEQRTLQKSYQEMLGSQQMVMRNRILAITRGSIPYVPELRPIAGSVTATILMQQLDYWFERYPDGFYKFQDTSPDNPAYKLGDSWAEELNFSVAELRNAFDQIGHRHKSKTEWTESTDPFNGKFYCCYTDRRTRLTFYFRNHAMVDAALDSLVITQGQSPLAPPNPMKPPVHAKSAGKSSDVGSKQGGFMGNEETSLTGNAQTQSTVNSQTAFTGNEQRADPVNPQSQSSHVDIMHSREMHDVNSAYTETTGLQKTTQKPQQPLPQGTGAGETLNANRGSGGLNDNFENLVFPKAEPIELNRLANLVASCRPENRQGVLDEVEGARQRGTLRSGIVPFARSLVKAEGEGLFTESLGVAVRAARELAARTAEAVAASARQAPGASSAPESAYTWTQEEIDILPPKMRERLLAKIGQGT
jgi:hypothetical protein